MHLSAFSSCGSGSVTRSVVTLGKKSLLLAKTSDCCTFSCSSDYLSADLGLNQFAFLLCLLPVGSPFATQSWSISH